MAKSWDVALPCKVCGERVLRLRTDQPRAGLYVQPIAYQRRTGAGGIQGYGVGAWARHGECK